MIRFVVFLLLALLLSAPAQADDYKSAFDRVMATNTIRCGYIVYSPYIRKDANSGELSGIFHDLIEEVGHNAGLKIEWTEEVGYETLFTDLDAKRYDVFCGGLWPSAARAKVGFFSVPLFYSVITAWARPDDHRFDSNLSAINAPDIRITTVDGAMEDGIAKTDFPLASRLSQPQLTPFVQNFMNITSGKADIVFAEPSLVHEFLTANPGALREVAPDHPLRVFGNSFVIGRGEGELLHFMDASLRELLYSGQVEKILQRYEAAPGQFRRAVKPYQ